MRMGLVTVRLGIKVRQQGEDFQIINVVATKDHLFIKPFGCIAVVFTEFDIASSGIITRRCLTQLDFEFFRTLISITLLRRSYATLGVVVVAFDNYW